MKPVCIYELKLLKKCNVRDNANSLTQRNEFFYLPTGIQRIGLHQEIKLHRLNARDIIHPDGNENDVVKEQENRIGPGITKIEDDYNKYRGPVKKITTTSFFGIYYDVSIPEFIREKLDPAYIKEIEFKQINEWEKKYEMEKILHGSIFKLMWYRIKRWWKGGGK